MVRDRPALQSMLAEQLMTTLAIVGIAQGFLYVEVVTPAWQLDAVVTPSARLLGDDFQRHIGPLAGKECRGSCHLMFSLISVIVKGGWTDGTMRSIAAAGRGVRGNRTGCT